MSSGVAWTWSAVARLVVVAQDTLADPAGPSSVGTSCIESGVPDPIAAPVTPTFIAHANATATVSKLAQGSVRCTDSPGVQILRRDIADSKLRGRCLSRVCSLSGTPSVYGNRIGVLPPHDVHANRGARSAPEMRQLDP